MRSEISKVLAHLQKKHPELHFEINDFEDSEFEHTIGVLSTGPDYSPDLQSILPEGWEFSGWINPDQRNNIGAVKRALKSIAK